MNNSEVAHAWAHRRGDSGHGSNFSYRGVNLYSYNTMIAKLFDSIVLITSKKYSNTTAKQIGQAFGAVSHMQSVRVPLVDVSRDGDYAEDHRINLRYILDEAKELQAKVDSTRTKADNKRLALININGLKDQVKLYRNYFNLKATGDTTLDQDIVFFIDSDDSISEDELKVLIEKQREDEEKRNEKHVAEWKAGKRSVINNYTFHAYLRVINKLDGDNVIKTIQTSKGLSIDETTFKALYKLWALKPNNILYHKVLGYEIQSATSAGIIVGCHNITASEIEAVAKILG